MSQTFPNHMGRDVLRTVYIITSVIQSLGGCLAHDPRVHVQDLWPHQVLPHVLRDAQYLSEVICLWCEYHCPSLAM